MVDRIIYRSLCVLGMSVVWLKFFNGGNVQVAPSVPCSTFAQFPLLAVSSVSSPQVITSNIFIAAVLINVVVAPQLTWLQDTRGSVNLCNYRSQFYRTKALLHVKFKDLV